SLRVASHQTGTKTLHVLIDGANVTGPVSYTDASGWQSWHTITSSSTPVVASGKHTVKIVFETSGYNLDSFDVSKAPTGTGGSGARDYWLWPFASTSPWNLPIGDGAQYAATANGFNVASLVTEKLCYVDTSSTIPVFQASGSNPLRTFDITINDTTQ